MNVPADFLLNIEDFQLRDFFETLSFKSYSLFLSFVSHFVRIRQLTHNVLLNYNLHVSASNLAWLL